VKTLHKHALTVTIKTLKPKVNLTSKYQWALLSQWVS